MKKVAFRTLGGKEIGYGHVYRCLSLAKAIIREDANLEIIFIVNDDITDIISGYGFRYMVSNSFQHDYDIIIGVGFDLIVFDSYVATNAYLLRMASVSKLLLFDDNNDIYDSRIPDILLNGNIHAKSLSYKTKEGTSLLLGPEYLVMKEDYWDDSLDQSVEKDGVLVTTGGSDTLNISPRIMKELHGTNFRKKIVIGPGYSRETIAEINRLKDKNTTIIMKPNGLKEYIRSSEYVITASGSTVYEVISQGMFPVIFSIAENQNIAYEHFVKAGMQGIGKFPDIRYNEIIPILMETKPEVIGALFKLVDGKGAQRVAQRILSDLNLSIA